jgi:predicted acylesterase/phospholipase RssA
MAATDETRVKDTVVLLGAGAPNSPLMAGALAAMYEKKFPFDMIYTSGGGCLIGLLLVAPKGPSPVKALQGLVEQMGVHDVIYSMVPIGYKTFFKPGPFTRLFHRWAQNFKMREFPLDPIAGLNIPRDFLDLYNLVASQFVNAGKGSYRRLYNDWINLWVAMMTPSTLNPLSQGMCAPFPFLDDMVDFDKLKEFPGRFYMNAYNITKGRMEQFYKDEITPAHFRAALAYPGIYPPAEINGQLYYEGADHDPINFGHLIQEVQHWKRLRRFVDEEDWKKENFEIKNIVLIDILESLKLYLIREPRNLWDAYGISIMTPVVALAEKNIDHFLTYDNIERDEHGCLVYENGKPKERYNFRRMNFTIPEDVRPYIMEWSYSNLKNLWSIGYVTGMNFCDRYFPSEKKEANEQKTYAAHVTY